jgi:hypothetical protein
VTWDPTPRTSRLRTAASTPLSSGVEGGQDELDHVDIYLGTDSADHYRFMSSRERANGPTFGDLGGPSLLDDGGTYSRAWRAVRRI